MEDNNKSAVPAQAIEADGEGDTSAKGVKREIEEDENEPPGDEPVPKKRKVSDEIPTAQKDKQASRKQISKRKIIKDDEEDEDVIAPSSSASNLPKQEAFIQEETGTEEDAEAESEEEPKPKEKAKAREKAQTTLKADDKDPYPDWKAGEPVPYAALCTTFSLIEMTTKRLVILSYCSAFLRQVLRLTPEDLLPTIQLMINKLAADYEGIELGIGESLIMKAIGETTGRTLQIIKADQKEIGDLGLVAVKSKSTQRTMFTPKALTVRGVHEGLMAIAVIQGQGSQDRKVAGIKKLLSAADAATAGKGRVDIAKDKGGPSEAKFIIRFLEGKLRLGLADKTILVALAQAMVAHEVAQSGKNVPSTEQMEKGEAILKTVYRYASLWGSERAILTPE